MNNSNLKDTLSTICGIVFAICAALVTANAGGLALPAEVVTVCGVLAAVSGAIIGFLTGKAPSGAKKTPEQVAAANPPKPQ